MHAIYLISIFITVALQTKNIISKSSATESIRSSVNNLANTHDRIQCDEICDIIAHHYYARHGISNGKVSVPHCVHSYNVSCMLR